MYGIHTGEMAVILRDEHDRLDIPIRILIIIIIVLGS